jgi:hypothetical protein
MSKPVVLLLGPSGAGKTTLGDALVKNLGVLHVLFDGHPNGNGVDVEQLRVEWDALLESRNPKPLADTVRRRIEAARYSGVVISCPSGIMPAEDGKAAPWHFPRSLLSGMTTIGVRCVVLVAPLAACMDAAIRRPGTRVTVRSWAVNNSNWTDFQQTAFPENVLETFAGGERRPESEVLGEFRRRFLG